MLVSDCIMDFIFFFMLVEYLEKIFNISFELYEVIVENFDFLNIIEVFVN